MTFVAAQRIRGKQDFEQIKAEGRKLYFGPFFVQYTLGSDVDLPRLGLIVSRKVGNAVVRNRAKRQIRELFRLNQEQLPKNLNLIVIAKKSFSHHSFEELTQSFEKLILQINQHTSSGT